MGERVALPHFSTSGGAASCGGAEKSGTAHENPPWRSLTREIRPKPSDRLHSPSLADNPPPNITTQRLLKPASRQYRQDGTVLDATAFLWMALLTFRPPGEHSQDQEDVS